MSAAKADLRFAAAALVEGSCAARAAEYSRIWRAWTSAHVASPAASAPWYRSTACSSAARIALWLAAALASSNSRWRIGSSLISVMRVIGPSVVTCW